MGKPNIESCVIDAFCQLVCEKAYDQVRISDICERAHISRKTFYSRFDNKEALLRAVVEKDISSSTVELFQIVTREGSGEPASILLKELQFERVYARRGFYTAMCSSECELLFERVISDACANCHIMLADRSSGSDGSRLAYASVYGSHGHSGVLIYWIKDGMRIPPKEMAQWLSAWGAASASVGF